MSCGDEMGSNSPETWPDFVKVSFDVGAKDNSSKIWYEENLNYSTGTKFDPTWNVGDEFFLVSKGSECADGLKPFVLTNSGERNTIEGELKPWEDPATLFAIYPFHEDYYSFDGTTFLYEAQDQLVNIQATQADSYKSTSNSMSNAVLLAVAKNAGFNTDSDGSQTLNVDYLFFKQAMSFLRFQIDNNDFKGHTLKKIWITDKDETIISKAKISINEDGEIQYDELEKTDRLRANFDNQVLEENSVINVALIQTTLSAAKVTITTEDPDGNYNSYTKDLPEHLKFTRNEFNFYSSPLKISKNEGDGGFKAEDNVFHLSEFAKMKEAPSYDKWIINTEPHELDDNLRPIVEILKKSNKAVSLNFPDLERINGMGTFQNAPNMKEVEMPKVRILPERTFHHCAQLTKIVAPNLTYVDVFLLGPREKKYPQVELIAATSPNIRLQYATDGIGIKYEDGEISRLDITLGNKELYEGDVDGNSIKMKIPHLNTFQNNEGPLYSEQKDSVFTQTFGKITWQD